MLVGFLGKKGSGKDTCGDYLVEKYGFVKKSFADPLKKACGELFLFENEQIYGTQEQKEMPDSRWFGCSPRKALQFVGTDLLRNHLDKIMPGLGHDIFVHHFKLWFEAERKINPKLRVVISDVRFENECEYIQKLGGIIIKLTRNKVEIPVLIEPQPQILPLDNYTNMHCSESGLDLLTSYDQAFDNNGTLEELHEKLDALCGKSL